MKQSVFDPPFTRAGPPGIPKHTFPPNRSLARFFLEDYYSWIIADRWWEICPTSGVNTRSENSTYGRGHPKSILALHAATTMFDLRNINYAR